MEKIANIQVILDQINSKMQIYGLSYGIFNLFILLLTYYLIVKLINRVKFDYSRKLVLLKNKLNRKSDEILEKYRKELSILFRDEQLRTNLIEFTIKNSDEIRLKLYKEVYSLFFEILFDLTASKKNNNGKVDKDVLDSLHEKVNKIRREIFINAVYLGKLTDFLLSAQIAMWDDLRKANADQYLISQLEKSKILDSSEQLHEAEKWIRNNIGTHRTLSEFELTEEAIKTIKSRRDELINDIFDKK
ncbi:hypothetical protein LEP1GSC202_2212 [Leptospira yanagawae serovar Saopaulo str. Sao Paulo = ATCC 700523]|uniref:Uncharacterized protein n=1 Tax=Leptospira yanagawae serovar Saopaulo str. Sao Paulo = ATCC 700523 TaxID=1249483 RepID=A0A5E8HH24_9LEPT|nr:hypothetical protein [Leptospira yanagawae]EOQ90791.1 hypothetical protein LEP1GSC202_2212 [Leptospira yanagawae serovar Saopaulo str. Sao Paulo = ATCC 700523]